MPEDRVYRIAHTKSIALAVAVTLIEHEIPFTAEPRPFGEWALCVKREYVERLDATLADHADR